MDEGEIRMVDITGKERVFREAIAEGFIVLKRETIKAIRERRISKGDVVAAAKLAAIQAVKRTWEVIPLCHPIPITGVDVDIELKENMVIARVTVKSEGKTGVEMEALTGVSVALLTVWDMVKALEKDEAGQYPHTEICGIKVVRKRKVLRRT